MHARDRGNISSVSFFIFPVKLLPEGLLMNMKYSSKISGQKIYCTADHPCRAKD
jgi:hypothetical protein